MSALNGALYLCKTFLRQRLILPHLSASLLNSPGSNLYKLGSLSSDDGEAQDYAWKKYLFEVRNYLDLLSTLSDLKPY